jgi:predicted RNA methylase
MPKQVTITPEVRAVLERCKVEGATVILPPEQLDRPLYQAVNKVLTALGGKWDRRTQGFLFAEGIDGQLREALDAGVAVDRKRTVEQFFTPPEIARQVIDLAGIEPTDLVLEPSAGAGALVAQALMCGAFVLAVEQDSAMMSKLLDLADTFPGGLRRVCADFLSWEPGIDPEPFDRPIDKVVMNPPFGNGADIGHVTRALHFLRPGGTLVAIMSPHWTFATSTLAQAFRGMVNDHSHTWVDLPANSFRSAGTDVNTGILTIQKGSI